VAAPGSQLGGEARGRARQAPTGGSQIGVAGERLVQVSGSLGVVPRLKLSAAQEVGCVGLVRVAHAHARIGPQSSGVEPADRLRDTTSEARHEAVEIDHVPRQLASAERPLPARGVEKLPAGREDLIHRLALDEDDDVAGQLLRGRPGTRPVTDIHGRREGLGGPFQGLEGHHANGLGSGLSELPWQVVPDGQPRRLTVRRDRGPLDGPEGDDTHGRRRGRRFRRRLWRWLLLERQHGPAERRQRHDHG